MYKLGPTGVYSFWGPMVIVTSTRLERGAAEESNALMLNTY